MMNEWGIPGVEMWSMTWRFADQLAKQGEYVPDLAFAGGITFEDQIFKALSLGAPYVKLVGMARSPMAAAMVGKTIGGRINDNQIPVYVERFGSSKEEIFVTAPELKHRFGARFDQLPAGAMGVYTYFERLSQGLRQLMAGARKFNLGYINRDDIASITREVADVSGIPFITDVDKAEVQKILKAK